MTQQLNTDVWQDGFGDMSPADFRAYGRQIVDWIADYMEQPDRYPVLSRLQPGQIAAEIATHPPSQPEPMEDILHDFEDIVIPGITHWNHPGFMAYFAITGSGPGILGELLSAGLNVNAMLWRTSPAATELETVTLDWLRQLLGLPGEFEGVIYDTASVSSLVAIAAARDAVGLDIRRKGMAGRPDLPGLRLYCSEEAHSSIEKDAMTLGIGQEGVCKIPTDSGFRMDVNALETAITADRERGLLPFCVVATVGTTSTTSVDPVGPIAAVCKQHDLWLHVDAAYGGAAAVLPEMRWVLDGVERADSFVVNPHKWLFAPIDLSAFYSRRLETVRQAFSLIPEYLRTSETESVRNYMDYGPQLGRRFRALKLWFVLRTFGQVGLQRRIAEHIRLGRQLVSWIDADPGWELMAPAPFSTVCFRFHPPDRDEAQLDNINRTILDRVNTGGEVFLSHTRLHGHLALRAAIGNLRTEERHVHRAWELLRRAALEL